jgi:hypothetical protein
MTCRRMTPEEIERADAAYRQWWLHVLTLGLIPNPNPNPSPNWRSHDERQRSRHLPVVTRGRGV